MMVWLKGSEEGMISWYRMSGVLRPKTQRLKEAVKNVMKQRLTLHFTCRSNALNTRQMPSIGVRYQYLTFRDFRSELFEVLVVFLVTQIKSISITIIIISLFPRTV